MDSPPLHIVGIDHLLLKVGDMETALSFYVGVLGCAIKSRLPQYGMAEIKVGDQGLDLVEVQGAGEWAGPLSPQGNVHHLCLAVEAEEASLRAHLARHDAEIVEERVEDGRLSLYVADPFGNQVELRFPQRP
jgi:catechol 2,3-dioxygenase-like lactoylglutathione lyase family enzyme